MSDTTFVTRIDAVLPQTQCTRCGFDGCLPYAQAIAAGGADINRCPPGGDATVVALSQLTARAVKPVDREYGAPGPLLVATIDEAACIGCTLCIEACPVDAIVGAQKRMHAILPSLCSGCELCVAPCPVDCIVMAPAGREWTTSDAQAARARHRVRNQRIVRNERIADRKAKPVSDMPKREAAIAAALARARARRSAFSGNG